jgi:hypothetical protein
VRVTFFTNAIRMELIWYSKQHALMDARVEYATILQQFHAADYLNAAVPLDGIKSVAMTRYGSVIGTITTVQDIDSSGNFMIPAM